MDIRRGEVYYITDAKTTGSEQQAGRPAVVVSNDALNAHSPVVEVVYLTTAPKRDMPTHVTISPLPMISTALCEQISSVSIERVSNYAGVCSDSEMERIDQALLKSLDIQVPTSAAPKPLKAVPVNTKELEELRLQLEAVQRERDLYKAMYDNILQGILRRPGND